MTHRHTHTHTDTQTGLIPDVNIFSYEMTEYKNTQKHKSTNSYKHTQTHTPTNTRTHTHAYKQTHRHTVTQKSADTYVRNIHSKNVKNERPYCPFSICSQSELIKKGTRIILSHFQFDS